MIARKLGLGLDALLPAPQDAANAATPHVAPGAPHEIPVDQIRPNPAQPRTHFDEEDIASLAASIRKTGVLQPVVVRRKDGAFELIAGERRLRASKLAGRTSVPVVVREADDHTMLHLALIENVQRRDLNPIEKARAFRQLLQLNGWTQDQAADALGLGRPTIANFIRLLELPPEIQEAVSRGTISMGHARALLASTNRTLQLRLLREIVTEDLSVRAVEKTVAASGTASARPSRKAAAKEPHVVDLERRLSQFFGTRVTLDFRAKGGQMVVDWFSNDQFNGLIRKLGV